MRNEFDGIVIQDQQVLENTVSCSNLRVAGVAEFLSDVEADFVDISGEACFDVGLSCDKFTIRGRCVCKCGLLASSVRVFGGMAIYGRLHAETVIVGGSLKFRSAFHTSSLLVRPGAYMKGSAKLRASKCVINGSLNNAGVLSADTVNITSDRQSIIQEIRCENLTVKAASPSASRNGTSGISDDLSDIQDTAEKFLLRSDFVDCYTADIELCNIEKLYCDSAIIRKGCVIHEILYRDNIEIEQGAHVERLSKT